MRGDGDEQFRTLNMRLRATQLKPGEVSESENGRMDVDGSWQTREGYKNLGGVTFSTADVPILVDAGEAGELHLFADADITSAQINASNILGIGCSGGHGLTPRTESYLVNIDGIAFTTTDPNGNRAMVATSSTQLIGLIDGAPAETYTITSGETLRSFVVTGDQVALRGACLFSDPDDSNIDYIIIADNAQASAFKVSDPGATPTTINYPASETLGQRCDLIQEFDNVVLRQEGKTSWYFDPDDATYGFGGSDPTAPAFQKFSTGAATQHTVFNSSGNTAISNGVATVTESNSLSAGDKLLLVSATDYDFLEGTTVEVATASGSNFTYYVNAEDNTSTSIVYSTQASLGGGYVNPPGAPWGVYHQRRSWLPYTWDSANPPTQTDRNQDEIIASDILSHVYDPISNQFRISGGTADHVVALHGYDDDRLLVLMRNSIHYIRGVSGSLGDAETIQLTTRIGCVARKSVVQTPSNQILFLGDKGVYAISFRDELNLRGTDLPLSEAVNPIISRITPGAADLAVGIYHDDRYWLALPLDGNEFNSHILIFNFITGGWESLDRPRLDGNDQSWAIEELIQARSGKVNELYAITTFGGIHKLDQTNSSVDTINGGAGTDTQDTIPGKLVTRQYSAGTIARKKFSSVRAQLKSGADASHGDMTLITEDPDETVDLGQIRDEFSGGLPGNEDGTVHKRAGNARGTAAKLQFETESGRPAVRAVQINAIPAESTNSFS